MPDLRELNPTASGSHRDNETSDFRIPFYTWFIAGALSALLTIGAGVYIYRSSQGGAHTPAAGYMGPQTCAECHAQQATSWAQTKMAKSFDVLRPGQKIKEKQMAGLDPDKDYSHDEFCLPCHTTGYGKVGGFRSIEETPHMAGVTCEACHGAGGMYVHTIMDAQDLTFKTSAARQAGLVYPPTARVCRGCHNEDSPFVSAHYEFNYQERVKKGTHTHFTLKYKHN